MDLELFNKRVYFIYNYYCKKIDRIDIIMELISLHNQDFRQLSSVFRT